MGIDIVLFKAKKINQKLANCLAHQDIDEMQGQYYFSYITEQTYQKHEKDYQEISALLTPVKMKRTFIDREKYMAAAGIPQGLQCYSYTIRGTDTIVTYEENGKCKRVTIPYEDVHKFDYVKEETYYVYERTDIDVDVYYSIRDIVWDIINKSMQDIHNDNKKHTYSPHKLNPKESMRILKAIAKAYKDDEIYVCDDSVPFIMELLTLEDKNIFIMGED